MKKTSPPSSISNNACGCSDGCCTIYEKSWVRDFLGDSFHPGGIELTQRSIESLGLAPRSRILDLACGTGITARLFAEKGHLVIGLDASANQVENARNQSSNTEGIRFIQGQAESPDPDLGTFNALFCECAFSLIENKVLAARNWFDRLMPGGLIALSDMIVNGQLPESLTGQVGSWACLGGALSQKAYEQHLLDAGFRNIQYSDERDAVIEGISTLKRKLLLYGISNLAEVVEDIGVSLPELHRALKDAAQAVKDNELTYGRFVAEKPIV